MDKHQQIMIEDGAPDIFVTLTPEQRAKAWLDNPPRPMPSFNSVPKTITDQETLKLLSELEARKKLKTNARVSKMLIKKEDHTGQHWNSRKAQWVSDEKGPSEMISITTNTRGSTKMTTKAYKDMSLVELAEAYNKISGKPPIKKFKDRAAGLKRLEQHEMTTATKEVKAALPARAAAPKKEGIAADFEFRAGSPREKLLLVFNEHLNKLVQVEKLASQVLGSKSTDNVKMISTLLAGVLWRIKVSKLAYEVKKEKTDGILSIGLFRKK